MTAELGPTASRPVYTLEFDREQELTQELRDKLRVMPAPGFYLPLITSPTRYSQLLACVTAAGQRLRAIPARWSSLTLQASRAWC